MTSMKILITGGPVHISDSKRYGKELYDLAVETGLDPAQKPRILDTSCASEMLGYHPQYSLQNFLQELRAAESSSP